VGLFVGDLVGSVVGDFVGFCKRNNVRSHGKTADKNDDNIVRLLQQLWEMVLVLA